TPNLFEITHQKSNGIERHRKRGMALINSHSVEVNPYEFVTVQCGANRYRVSAKEFNREVQPGALPNSAELRWPLKATIVLEPREELSYLSVAAQLAYLSINGYVPKRFGYVDSKTEILKETTSSQLFMPD